MKLSKRQIEIITAATVLIGKKGLQNLTTKKLAAEMGFSEPALYRHFGSKTEILKAVLLFYKNQMKGGLSEIIQKEKTGLDKIQAMLNFQFNHFSKYPAIIMVIFSETSFQYDNELSKVVSTIMMQKRKLVIQMIEVGQKDGSIRRDIDSPQLTTLIMGAMRFTILQWRMTDLNEAVFDLINEGEKLRHTLDTILQNKTNKHH